MKMEDIKVGMKVVPHSKTKACSFNHFLIEKTGEYYKNNGYLYVVKKLDDKIWLGENNERPFLSDTFSPSDVEPYIKTIKVKVVDSGEQLCDFSALGERYENSILKFRSELQVEDGDVLDLIKYTKHPIYNSIDLAICKNKDNYIIIIDKNGVEEIKESSLLDKVFQNHAEVELRNGIKGIVVGNKIHACADGCIVTSYDDYSELLCDKLNVGFDIVKATLNEDIVYEREEKWSEWKDVEGIDSCEYRVKCNKVQVRVCGLSNLIIGEANCMPDDEFDTLKGVNIAYNRAMIKLYQKKLKELTK